MGGRVAARDVGLSRADPGRVIAAACAVIAPLSEPAACVTTLQAVAVGAVLLAAVVIA